MSGAPPQIVALGGGGFSMEAGNPLLDEYVLGVSGSPRPRVCFLPSASGDADHYIVRFYRAFDAGRCEPSHVSLFRREQNPLDLRGHLLAQDVIYVGGGSVISLLGVWRAHGVDTILREAWRAGVVLCGVSAGSLCWFSEAVTAFHGEPVRVSGLGFLPWSNTVHYDGERERDLAYRAFLVDGLCAGYAAEDGTALHFVGDRLARVVSSRPRPGHTACGPSADAWSRRRFGPPTSPARPPRGPCSTDQARRSTPVRLRSPRQPPPWRAQPALDRRDSAEANRRHRRRRIRRGRTRPRTRRLRRTSGRR